MEVIHVKMNDVELGRALENILQHDVMMDYLVPATLIQTQRLRARSHQPRSRFRISARKQRYFMALTNQFLGEIRHYAFCSPVIFRRHALIKRRHLCNSHTQIKSSLFEFSRPRATGSNHPSRYQRRLPMCHLNPRDQLYWLFMFEYANENARTVWLSTSRDATDLTAPCAPPSSGRRFPNNFAWLFIVA